MWQFLETQMFQIDITQNLRVRKFPENSLLWAYVFSTGYESLHIWSHVGRAKMCFWGLDKLWLCQKLAKKCIFSELWPFELAICDLSYPLKDVSLEHLILQMAIALKIAILTLWFTSMNSLIWMILVIMWNADITCFTLKKVGWLWAIMLRN